MQFCTYLPRNPLPIASASIEVPLSSVRLTQSKYAQNCGHHLFFLHACSSFSFGLLHNLYLFRPKLHFPEKLSAPQIDNIRPQGLHTLLPSPLINEGQNARVIPCRADTIQPQLHGHLHAHTIRVDWWVVATLAGALRKCLQTQRKLHF